MPVRGTAILCEAFRRAVLKLFVDRALFDTEVAESMLGWVHSGFSVDNSVWLDQADRAAHDRLARYSARNPVSLERLEYDARTRAVRYGSDKTEGPTAGSQTFDALDFIALVAAHIPDRGQVMQRYYGYYANRSRGQRRRVEATDAQRAGLAPADGGLDQAAVVTPEDWRRRAARLRWAELLRRIYEVDPLRCPACGIEMRVIAVITEPKVVDRILAHLRAKGHDPRAGPWRSLAADAPPIAA